MGLLADQQHGRHLGPFGPHGEIEDHAEQQRHDHIGDLGRQPRQIDDRQRLSSDGNAQQPAEQGRQIVMGGTREHETEAAVGMQRFEARTQPHEWGGSVGLVQFSHGFVDDLDQIAGSERNRRIDGDPGICCLLACIVAARLGDHVFEDGRLGLLFLGRAAAYQHGHQLLEIEQPTREFEIVHIEQFSRLAEGCGIFVMRVEQNDMGAVMGVEDRAQQQRHGAGLAGPGRADDGKMFGQEIVGDEKGRTRLILVDGSDPRVEYFRPSIDEPHIAGVGCRYRRAQLRINGNTTAKTRHAIRAHGRFAEQIDFQHGT